MIYFAAPVARLEPIKVGYTKAAVHARVACLSASSCHPLELIAQCEGGPDLERALHLYLADSRQHGEWFLRSPRMEIALKDARAGVLDILSFPDEFARRFGRPPVRSTVGQRQRYERELVNAFIYFQPDGLKHLRRAGLLPEHRFRRDVTRGSSSTDVSAVLSAIRKSAVERLAA